MRKILKAFCITLLALCIAGNGLLIPNHVFADVADTAPEEEALITKDYPEMARQLELLYERADIGNNRLNPTYGAMMKREEVISLTPSLQNRLRQLAKPTFSDIAGDEWYAPHIPMAVYRKLMNGFPDSTFRGKTPVTRAELLTMLARFNDSEGTIKQKARQDAKSRELIAGLMGDKWYTDYIVVSRDGLIHLDQYTRDTIVEPMTRGEVFYALANLLWKEDIREGGKYHAMAVKNENPAFSDTGKTITIANPDAYGSGAESFQWYKQYMRAAENPKAGVPMDIYPAIICLKEKGILQGSNGESKWYDSISRGEALALFERLAKVWGEEERGKAESYDTEHDNAEVPGGGGTSGGDPGSGSSGPGDPDTRIRVLPGVNVEVGEEVYFDGAYYLGEYDESVQWEWDFGDGYTLKAGEPKNTTFDTGLCVIHYFMIPGTYEVRLNASLNYDSRGVIDLWAEAMDTFSWNMDDLIPLGTFVETQNVTTWDRMSNNKYETEWDAGPTPGDLRTQLWTAIVHNMKAVFYFNHFAETPMDNMSVLNEFNEAVTDLAPVILAPPSSHTVTHNCHKRGQRVDLMVRETTTDYYIFAVRVTEPESEWGEVPEPDNIEFVLNTGTQATAAYDILPGYSWEYGLFDVTEAKKTFHFDLKEGIKPGSVLISVADKVTGVIPEKLVDRWTDKEYSAVLDKQGVFANGYDDGAGKIVPIHSFKNIKRGTIDYDTGEVNVEFNNNVPQGESYIQIAYAVNDRPVRTLTGTGGVFRDTLERNAVRIYRIPKDQH